MRGVTGCRPRSAGWGRGEFDLTLLRQELGLGLGPLVLWSGVGRGTFTSFWGTGMGGNHCRLWSGVTTLRGRLGV